MSKTDQEILVGLIEIPLDQIKAHGRIMGYPVDLIYAAMQAAREDERAKMREVVENWMADFGYEGSPFERLLEAMK